MRGLMAIVAVSMAAVPTVTSAQERNAYTQIASGDYASAEQTLIAERRIFPQKPELMLNLAAVYQRMGRTADAQALYAAVLAQPDMLMDVTGDRTAWSHRVAQNGQRRLLGMQLSSR